MRTEGNDALTESAGRIADGESIDWRAQAEQTPELAHELEALARVARIAEGWRAVGVTPAADDAEPGEPALLRWGALEGREKLGEGTFGEVWRAWDPALRREVALKLRREGGDEPSVRRELDEARRLARVRHPNVLAIHGVDVHEGRAGLWTDLVRGRTLEQLLAERGTFGAHEAAGVGCDLCRALAAVHAAGLVHGDVKASNVMREEGGRIVLMDFGSGREARDEGSGAVTASPLAAAPELLNGGPPSASSDLYALGVLLFRLVGGRYPVEADSLAELRQKHTAGTRASLRALRPELPTPLVAAIERALDPAPAARFPDAGAFELALAATGGAGAQSAAPRETSSARVTPLPAAQRPRAPWAALAAAAAAVAVLGWFAARDPLLVPPLPEASAPRTSTAIEPASPARRPNEPRTAAPVLVPPEVAITLWRGRDGVRTVVGDGDPVRPGDHLWLEFRGGEPLHVYVLDEDEHGQTFALFPIAGTDLVNPLRARSTLRLPGTREGVAFDWVVTSAGGHERLLIVASRRPLAPLERLVAAVPAADPGQPVAYAELDEGAFAALRGIGGMAPAPVDAREGRLSQVERTLSAQTQGGYWLRHFVLAGP